MTSSPNLGNIAMIPSASYFYPTAPPQQSSKWLADNNNPHRNSNDQASRVASSSSFRTAESIKCSTDVRWPTEIPYQIQRIHPAAAAAAAAAASANPSVISEVYPTDPFPSTSMAHLPGNCCLNHFENAGNCYYPNAAMLTSSYANPTTNNEHFMTAEQIAHWKVPAFAYAPFNCRRTSTRTHQQQTISPPYRTGPGTNNVQIGLSGRHKSQYQVRVLMVCNDLQRRQPSREIHVRVRTSEKYRMVYTDYQRLELEKEFRTSQFINSERKSQLSSELQLTERQVKIWFQNRSVK
ncbi:unnamed protein product [Thelazia callipaeda]|uniref:Homeobox domain-containing protein n=1 Tax=Thelazia callipaeda TaxID=103827 RepID=A0A0N5CQQ6_THECL|nr:unnamed protein product [Thelazia callipaeda]